MKVSSGPAPLPFYPGSIALDSPRVFRLPSIDGVTYAPWYDAARFDKRSHPAFDLHAQLRQLAVNLPFLKDQILGAGAALLVPLLILVWYAPRASFRHFAATWFCTLPAAAVVGMYLLVHLVQRFVLGFSLATLGCRLGVGFCAPRTATLGTPGNAGWDPCLCCLYDARVAPLRRFTANGIGRARHGYCRGHFPTPHRSG